MATSIDDLLTAVHGVLVDVPSTDPLDASRALDYSAQLLTRLREDGFGDEAAAVRDATVRRLADACHQASIAFDSAPGRVSELVGVTGDAAGRLRDELGRTDRWTIAIRLAIPARRCAAAITASGPYAQVPQLLSVADRSRELLQVAAASPPEPDSLHGHDLLIPSPTPAAGSSATRAVLEQTASLLAELRRRDCDPVTVREVVGLCHVAGRAAQFAEQTEALQRTERAGRRTAAASWRAARDTVAMYTDGVPPARRSTLLAAAARLDATVRRASANLAESVGLANDCTYAKADLMMIRRYLAQAARVCSAEISRTRPNLFVRPGPRPLHAERVGEWLRHETYPAAPPDLQPALASLRVAEDVSAILGQSVGALSGARATTGRGTSWEELAM